MLLYNTQLWRRTLSKYQLFIVFFLLNISVIDHQFFFKYWINYADFLLFCQFQVSYLNIPLKYCLPLSPQSWPEQSCLLGTFFSFNFCSEREIEREREREREREDLIGNILAAFHGRGNLEVNWDQKADNEERYTLILCEDWSIWG